MKQLNKLSSAETFVPRTLLGRKLLSLRNRAIRSGMRLLNVDEVLGEVKRRRVGFGWNAKEDQDE